jgi:hypothetical protein
MATRDVFSEDEQAQLRAFPEIGRVELIRHFTLTDADAAFLRRFRTGRNVLGAAVQLCVAVAGVCARRCRGGTGRRGGPVIAAPGRADG